MPPRFDLDHIAVAAASLEAGAAHVREALGIEMPPGGSHLRMGTHNRLLRLGEDEFLEVIAIDPAAPKPAFPRWFALDSQAGRPPRLATWIARTSDLDAVVAALPPSLGQPREESRGTLTWRITVPDDGAMPFDGAQPAVIQWPAGPLPGSRMADLGCRLERLTIGHPNADIVAARLAPMLSDPRIVFDVAREPRLTAEIMTPRGLRTLT